MVAMLFGLIVIFHLVSAAAGRPLLRATPMGTALEYAKGPIDLLRPVIVGFNANGTPTALELPIWQASVGAVFKLTGSKWYGWGNIVSLLLFATCLWPFLKLGRHYAGERVAWWALAFFLAQPLIVVFAGEASPDGFALVTAIWFLFFADRLIRTGAAWLWVPTAVFALLAALSKLPFFMTAGFCAVFLLVANGIWSWKRWLLLGSAGAAAAVAFAAWSAHCNALAARAEFPYVEMRMSESSFIRYWFFGDLAYRLGPGHWVKGAWRFLHATAGALPMSVLLVPALLKRGNALPKLWLFGAFLTTLVFTHLVLEHWHYYLMCCPAVALLCAGVIARLDDLWSAEWQWSWLRLVLAATVLVFSAVEGVLAMKIAIDLDDFPKRMAQVIQTNTGEKDKLVVYQQDPNWGGEVLFRSGREGLSVIDLEARPGGPAPKGLLDILKDPADLARLKALGFNRLVLISESPVRYAVEAANPGRHRARNLYPSGLTPEADRWRVVYRSEDLLIKEIP